MIIDTHVHLQLCEHDPATLIANAKAANVTKLINVGTSLESSQSNLDLANRFPGIVYPTAGIHPCYKDAYNQLDTLATLVKTHTFHAIGECGFDFHYPDSAPADQQETVFRAQLDLARNTNLPVIIHTRKADPHLKPVLDEYSDIRKVIHCYGGSWDFTQTLLSNTTWFSFTGQITFAKKGKTIRTLKNLPLDRIMIETDAPYLTPDAFLGQKNEPAFVPEIAKKIAEVKDLPLDTVIKSTTNTATDFFNLNA